MVTSIIHGSKQVKKFGRTKNNLLRISISLFLFNILILFKNYLLKNSEQVKKLLKNLKLIYYKQYI